MDFEKLIAYRNTQNPFAQTLGIVVEEIRQGYGRATKVITEADLNPIGKTHGGIYFTMADVAVGSASAASGYMAVTLNANWNFMHSAGIGDKLTAEAVATKSGKTICVFDVTVKDQNENLLGTGTFTFYTLDQKIEL